MRRRVGDEPAVASAVECGGAPAAKAGEATAEVDTIPTAGEGDDEIGANATAAGAAMTPPPLLSKSRARLRKRTPPLP